MASQRIERLKKSIHVDKYPMCIEKVRWITESYQQTEGEPEIIRRAKALVHVLDHITIFIEDDELIVGNGASKPMGVEIDYYYSTWPKEEITGLTKEGWDISEQDIADVISMNEYWKHRNLISRIGVLFDEERLWPFMQTELQILLEYHILVIPENIVKVTLERLTRNDTNLNVIHSWSLAYDPPNVSSHISICLCYIILLPSA